MSMVSSNRINVIVTLALFIAGFVLFRFVAHYLAPQLMFTTQDQPVDFSHVIHGEDVGAECEDCHFFYDDGSWSGTPTVEVCADCHEEMLGESAAEQTLVSEYIETGKEIQWALYFRQPQCVSFSHSSHVRTAKLVCETCHGPQGLSERPVKYMVNRITRYTQVVYASEPDKDADESDGAKGEGIWGTMGMDQCAECHRTMGTSTACFICHK